MRVPPRWRLRALLAGGAVLAVVLAASFYWRDDILRTRLDPKTPYQTYRPPPAPDYAARDAWAMLPADPGRPAPGDPPADVFFVHPTTYDGGRDWNGPTDDPRSRETLEHDMLPNYAEPYRRVGRLFAPRYRQASLYARLTLRDDALDARAFAYRDVRRAFDTYLQRWGGDRPIVLVGVEQGGRMVDRLAAEAAAAPGVRERLVVVHLVQSPTPVGRTPPPCRGPEETGCRVGFVAASEYDLGAAARLTGKATAWTADGRLEAFGRRPMLCVNPVTGALGARAAPESAARGAAAAAGLEAGARPPLMPAQAAAHCDAAGVLRYARPRSPALQRDGGGWAAGLRMPPFNLFWADLEADAQRRTAAWVAARPPAPPLRPSAGG